MLKRLIIQNYALIDSLDISFPDGLVIITGETGAGKSILLGAISLLLGNKADMSVFKDNTKNCVVEGDFDDDTLLRRVISPSGRSRSFLNDEPVSLSQLSQISNKIIDIHAQHQHLLLTDPEFQLSVLDHFAGDLDLLRSYQKIYKECISKQEEIKKLNDSIDAAVEESEYKKFQWEQLKEAKLCDGELEELESEQKCLANAEEIKTALFSTLSLFNPYDVSIVQNLKEASSLLSKSSKYLSSIDEIINRVDSSRIELNDIEDEISHIAEQITVSPERLMQVDERLSLIYSLLKKHRCTTLRELIEITHSLESSLSDTESMERKHDELLMELEKSEKKRGELCNELSAVREKAAVPLSERLQALIQSLEMQNAAFKVHLFKSDRLSIDGGDSLSFLFNANGSEKLGDISKVASGGELSRVMLALKSLMSEYTHLPTMIFDEIDTGVSGRIADKMGDLIGKMGDNMQIFAITHLPQIASKKGAHFLVYKEFDGNGGAQTKIKELSHNERIMELARMLSGSSLSEAAVENAKVLLKENLKY